MELLRERDLRAYRSALDKAETAAIDELAVQSAAREEHER
jgi:flagellar biosynthesis chaperone FliJ